MKVFYRPEMISQPRSYSQSAIKPRLVVNDWLANKVLRPHIDVESFPPADVDEIKLAHDPDFVDAVLSCQAPNGFGSIDADVAASLPFTVGSMLAAAEYAVTKRAHVCSPTSGFHHAGYAFSGGYCTFNGLMVALMNLKSNGMIRNAAIIDCDVHQGNGTQDIIEHLDLGWVKHYSMGQHFEGPASVGAGGRKFLRWLTDAIDDSNDTDLVLYQAGADAHILDPLGGLLPTKAMHERDVMVASITAPLVWNLAGGYRKDARGTIKPVLDLHRHTALVWTKQL